MPGTASIVWPMSTVANPPVTASVDRSEFGGFRLLLSDLRTAWILLAEADYRCLAKIFGVRRDQTTMVTLIGAMMLAEAVRTGVAKAFEGVARPSLKDAALTSGVVKEGLHMIAGPSSRDVPLGSLIAIVLVTKFSRPAVRQSAHAIRSASHLAHEEFIHRYGHLLGVNGRRRHLPRPSPHLLQPQRSS